MTPEEPGSAVEHPRDAENIESDSLGRERQGVEELSQGEIDEAETLIRRGLVEDVPGGDVTSEWLMPPDVEIRACFVPRQEGILCGMPVVASLFREIDPDISLRPLRSEGDRLVPGEPFLEIEGAVQPILRGERLALNFLQLLSGISTLTRRYVDEIVGTSCGLYDTRKTTPGWRFLQKYAVRIGGGKNHRRSLSDFALIKDNHRQVLRALGDQNIADWIQRIRQRRSEVLVELEVDQLDELRDALTAGLDIILLDNFSIEGLSRAVEIVRAFEGPRPQLEAS